MSRVLVTPTTILLVLDAPCLLLLVFRRRVVSPFALSAFQRDNISHVSIPRGGSLRRNSEPSTGIEPVTSSLPRTRSTN